MNEVELFCIVFGLWLALLFFGVGVAFGRGSKDIHQDASDRNNNSISGDNRIDNLCNCDLGDDLK